VLPDLLQVLERALLALHHRAHTAERGALQRLAAVERVAVLEQLDVVAPDLVDELLRQVQLAQRQLEVVAVVQHVDQVRVEGVDVVQPRKVGQDLGELVVVVHVRELNLREEGWMGPLSASARARAAPAPVSLEDSDAHLAHVELADPDDVVARVHDGGRLALRLGEDHVDELLGRRHRLDLLEVVDDHILAGRCVFCPRGLVFERVLCGLQFRYR